MRKVAADEQILFAKGSLVRLRQEERESETSKTCVNGEVEDRRGEQGMEVGMGSEGSGQAGGRALFGDVLLAEMNLCASGEELATCVRLHIQDAARHAVPANRNTNIAYPR